MFSLGRSPLCSLLVAIIAVAATTSIASAFMPPDLAAMVRTATPQSATPIVQHLSGPHHNTAAIDSAPTKPNPKRKHAPAVHARRPKQTPPLRAATAPARKLANLMLDLREPPTQQPVQADGLKPLIDLRAALERMDDLAKFYRNRNQMPELEAALKQRVHLALRIAELDAIAKREGDEAAMAAFLQSGTPNHRTIDRALSETERQYTKTQKEIGDIDDQIAQLQRRRSSLDRQLTDLGQKRSTLRAQLVGTPGNVPPINPAIAKNDEGGATTEAERLADAIHETDAILSSRSLSRPERQAMERRRADMAKQLAAAVMRACRLPSRDTARVVTETTQQPGNGALIVTDLRSTIRELRMEVSRVSDELLRAQQNLVQRFGEIERRGNVIEAGIRTRMGMRVNAGEKTNHRTKPAGEHAALGSQND